ncbi:taurine dioxygenase [Pseudomonas typographi]|uniref:Taurine dioxygenase n=1 Tax=Pseudomonas typographi TaxID=2715964 RepID=A0ABR7YX24_9PSED|nr:taurine dioxygenase [Pseudomonas typographi]MBD1586281.1 taurine dioxygenase [Pseudomonas typographi]MBD1597753.1 taurine dioxygenase [Pseudomonas typographi]
MAFTLRPLSPALGAVLDGLDLRQPLGDADLARFEQALLDHQVLFMRGQQLTPAQHMGFAQRFGELHIHPIYPHLPEQPQILVLDTAVTDVRDNALWHSDVSFLPKPAMAGVLLAREVPAYGGDTLWASGTAAYEALSAPLKRLLDGLSATHDFSKSFPLARFGNTPEALQRWEATRRRHPPVSHPVVRTHPASGRPALFVNEGFTLSINELEPHESDALLRLLFQHATLPPFCVRWQWRTGDLAFWDNRVTQHYAVDDYRPQRRVMHRATVLGDAPH